MTPPPTPPPPPPPPRDYGVAATLSSGRTIAVLVLIMVAVAAGLAGIALDRAVFLRHHFGGRPPMSRMMPMQGRGRAGFAPRVGFRERFGRAVGLSADQQTKVDSIMERQLRELRTIRDQTAPRIDSVLAQTRRQIDSVLTPDQRKRAEQLRQRMGPGRGPGMDRGMGGAPGGPAGPPEGPGPGPGAEPQP